MKTPEKTRGEIAFASICTIGGRQLYIAPNGVAHDTTRTGERRNGRLVSSPELSDHEISRLGMTGLVASCPTPEVNDLYQATCIDAAAMAKEAGK